MDNSELIYLQMLYFLDRKKPNFAEDTHADDDFRRETLVLPKPKNTPAVS